MRISFLVTTAVLLLAASLFRVSCAETGVSSHADFYGTNGIDADNDSDYVPTPKEEVVVEVEETEKDRESYESMYTSSNHQWMTAEQGERLVLFEGEINQTLPVDCCPAFYEMTAPTAARNLKGYMVSLYRTEEVRQQFVEVSCKPDVVNQPCRFMHRLFHSRSKCIQKYSYSYALVLMSDNETAESVINATNAITEESPLPSGKHPKPIIPANFHTDTERYMLDHVRIRSGCNCEIDPKKPKADLAPKKTKKVTKMKRKMKKKSGILT